MGMWVERYNNTIAAVQYSHNWKFCQYGCMEGYFTAHYQSPRQMICLWDKLSRGRARCCNFRWPHEQLCFLDVSLYLCILYTLVLILSSPRLISGENYNDNKRCHKLNLQAIEFCTNVSKREGKKELRWSDEASYSTIWLGWGRGKRWKHSSFRPLPIDTCAYFFWPRVKFCGYFLASYLSVYCPSQDL